MALLDRLRAEWIDLSAQARVLPLVPKLLPSSPWNASRWLSHRAERAPDDPAIKFEEREYTWGEVDAIVQHTARAFERLGIGPTDVVAVLMDNRPEFVFALTAISRLGARAALINTNITGQALVHAIEVGRPKRVLVGAEHAAKLEEVLPDLPAVKPDDVLVQRDGDAPCPEHGTVFDTLVEEAGPGRLARNHTSRGSEIMCFIYTSGTTGLPKAAIVTNQRFVATGAFFASSLLRLGPGDTVYITLPLYHSSAMFGGWSAVLASGACMALRRRFSASNFWSDVRRYDATGFVYIGELCRYLLNTPVAPGEKHHQLRAICGNGLRPDIWERFQERFAIPTIREFYGATEGNLALANFAGRPGMVGRLRPGNLVVRCDLESGEPLRDDSGHCTPIEEGGTGLLLGRITPLSPFDGYVDEGASEKKILKDVLGLGDRYFNSGDLVTIHEDGWVSFADRVGDTFRWKGENVSTNEVAEILNGAPGVLESNVFGVQVPGTDGRAGMACLHTDTDFTIEGLASFVGEQLPTYQRPYFVRLLGGEMRITGTFKHQKTDYRKEGYDPDVVQDPLFVLDGDRYRPFDAELQRDLVEGRLSLR